VENTMRVVASAVAGILAVVVVAGCGESRPLAATAEQMPNVNDPVPRGNCARTAVTTPVQNPTVTGPIPATVPPGDPAHDYPFFATQFDLTAAGYVEEEYFFEGAGGAYKSRMVVRRPAKAEDFNCTLLVEWYNTTNGYDVEVDWIYGHEQIMRDGYAWVGISAQTTNVVASSSGIASLAKWSPSRYGSLHSDSEGLAFEIWAEGIKAARAPGAVDPLGGLPVTRVIALGASQSSIFEQAYYNSNQAKDRVIENALSHGSR